MGRVEPLECGTQNEEQQFWAPWWAFCGWCTPIDCLSCCTAYWAPCIAYGYVTSKVFNASFWKSVGKFCLVFGLWWLLVFITNAGTVANCRVDIPADPDTPVDPPKFSDACMVWQALSSWASWLGIFCALAWALHIGGPYRTQLRRRLGISGIKANTGACCRGASGDACVHFCCLCCALAQEMRTVMHLEAAAELPPAAPEGYEPLIAQAPAVDGGMSRVVGVPAGKSAGNDMV